MSSVLLNWMDVVTALDDAAGSATVGTSNGETLLYAQRPDGSVIVVGSDDGPWVPIDAGQTVELDYFVVSTYRSVEQLWDGSEQLSWFTVAPTIPALRQALGLPAITAPTRPLVIRDERDRESTRPTVFLCAECGLAFADRAGGDRHHVATAHPVLIAMTEEPE